MEAARAERFLNSRAKNPADALCTREEGACPEKEAERTWNGDREELSVGRVRDDDKDVRCFLSSYTRARNVYASVIFSENNVGQPERSFGVGSFRLSISGKKLFEESSGRERRSMEKYSR